MERIGLGEVTAAEEEATVEAAEEEAATVAGAGTDEAGEVAEAMEGEEDTVEIGLQNEIGVLFLLRRARRSMLLSTR